ncbi:hypothetical protein ONS95_005309 [Cadophora gregata]|uniref:uncharacterized protein n=1 Tax=Cadophora gregata TaxID=51156 RepID=UPI0026DAEAA0|nr:uncharacterized protein ONS95_005309 [Cadophora gregata]KAK0103276.1 hypothetical protein ONS95_005309 [Cadophora gregata]
MVSLRSGNEPVLAESNTNATSTLEFKKSEAVGTKRKTEDEIPDEEDKENVSQSDPKSRKLDAIGEKSKSDGRSVDNDKDAQEVRATTEEATKVGREHTPGRDGPIKEEQRSASPDIKSFKGPPGKKVRKTAYEKNEEYKQFIRETPGHTFYELYVCFDKGPNGSPTYDKSGFQLDYNKVADWMKPTPYNKSRMVNGMEKAIAKSKTESEQMAEIFFEKGEAPTDSWKVSTAKDYWKDRVSKDLTCHGIRLRPTILGSGRRRGSGRRGEGSMRIRQRGRRRG